MSDEDLADPMFWQAIEMDKMPLGKAVRGYVITCGDEGCGNQIFLRGKLVNEKKWWEQIGWGKIMDRSHGHRIGKLYCPTCRADALLAAAGDIEGEEDGN